MNTDPGGRAQSAPIACTLDNDTRLIAGVAAVAAHVARRAGLSERAETDISTAVAEACRETFRLLDSQPGSCPSIKLTTADFPDRVEVTIEFSGGALPVSGTQPLRQGQAARSGERIGKPPEGGLVDRVERETSDGRSRVTLIKYCEAAKSSQKP